MNAPATSTAVHPDAVATAAPGLVAWELIHRLVAFDTSNEWVTLDQLAQCEAFMRRLVEHVCV